MIGFRITAASRTIASVTTLLAATGLIVAATGLDAQAWNGIETTLCWVLGGALLVGFVALMVRYPRLARAIQTVLLVFIALETLGRSIRPRDR